MEMMKKVKVGDNEYTVKMFDPITGFDFCHTYSQVRSSGASLAVLGRQALGQCLDPMLRSLGDSSNFQAYFSEYPEDMLVLEMEAINALIDPFLPKAAVIK